MRILAIETATPASSVALGDGTELAAMAVRVDRRGHVGFLGSALDFCFHRAGWEPSSVDSVVVDVGPGLFTGMRAGLACAQGIAIAAGVPVIAATSLDALALRAATGRRRIWAVVDTRRGQVAVAPYRPVPGGVVRDGSPELVSPDELAALISSDPSDVLLVGDWARLPDGLFRGMHQVRKGRPRFPSAEILLEIAAIEMAKGDTAGIGEIRPMYMREPDVSIQWTEFREEGKWPEAMG